MRLLTVVGARPQFIKAAAVGYAIERAVARGAGLHSVLIHTGQHYDAQMSDVFFEELGIRPPDRELGIGSGSHGAQTGRMLEALETVLEADRPDVVLVYGDTNSTLAGALAAAKLHIPVAHVEAGLRSYNQRMPEEINRVLTDHVSRWLFCPGEGAVTNLAQEGLTEGVHVVGDVMYDLVLKFATTLALPGPLAERGITSGQYVLATIHRAENTDDATRLAAIFDALSDVARDTDVLVPLHPRTRKRLTEVAFQPSERLHLVDPLSYLQMIAAEAHAAAIVTDSGGVQKEAFWLGVPCVTPRDETEWTETLNDCRNILTGADRPRIADAVKRQLRRDRLTRPDVPSHGAADAILGILSAEVGVSQ